MYPNSMQSEDDSRKLKIYVQLKINPSRLYDRIVDGLLDFVFMAMVLSLSVFGILAIGL